MEALLNLFIRTVLLVRLEFAWNSSPRSWILVSFLPFPERRVVLRSPHRRVMRTYISAVSCLLVATALVVSPAKADFVDGNFATGTLAGWTVFTTSANGTNGNGLPDVVSFDTTGTGATNSAQFNVGQLNSFVPGDNEGGGLSQSLVLATGIYTVTAAIAAAGGSLTNAEAGIFSILVDGVLVGTPVDFGGINGGQTLRGNLSDTVSVSAGTHTFSFEITRGFGQITDGLFQTPDQYITDLTISGSVATPEPSHIFLAGLCGLGALGLRGWRSTDSRT